MRESNKLLVLGPALQAARCLPVMWLHSLCWLAYIAMLSGCATSTLPANGQARLKVSVEVADTLRRYEVGYLLQPGDQLEIFVYRHQEFSRKVVIRPDGMISLPLVGELKAAALEPKALARLLSQRYAVRLRDPEVTVLVENPPEPSVFVVGQVGAPKAIPLRSARTLAQAMAQSGDATRFSAPDSISVVRLNSQGHLELHQAEVVSSEPSHRSLSQPEIYMAMNSMLLQPNDVIVVPESIRAQLVRALGDVSTVLAPLLNAVIFWDIIK